MSTLQFASPREIEEIQWLQLQKQLLYLERTSSYYKRIFEENSMTSGSINSLADFRKIPLTTKEDLQRFNNDFLCIPKEGVIDHVTTSGTLGKPVSLFLNEADLQRLAENEMESFKIVGIEKNDVVQITTTLDRRFMAGMAYFLGLRKLGAGIIRTGSGLPQLQWDSIERFEPKYLIAVPSFLLKMIEYAKDNNIDYRKSSVKAAICIGEPLRTYNSELNALGKRIKELWEIELFSTYASTEMATAFTECEYHQGLHSQPELIFYEILDTSGEPVLPGEIGELVITNLQTQTMPLLRYSTGDMLTFYNGTCACGRNSGRLSAVIGRKQQMIKYRGTSIYPQSIIEVLNDFKGVGSFVIEASKGEFETDEVTVKVADISLDAVEALTEIFRSRLQVVPLIEIVSREEIAILRSPKESRKPLLFRDYR